MSVTFKAFEYFVHLLYAMNAATIVSNYNVQSHTDGIMFCIVVAQALKVTFNMQRVQLRSWNARGVVVGYWKSEPLEHTVNGRRYQSDYTPYWQDGRKIKLTHTGKYLKMSFSGRQQAVFHRQLKQDLLGRKLSAKWHVHHVDDNPLHNQSTNLQWVERALHPAVG